MSCLPCASLNGEGLETATPGGPGSEPVEGAASSGEHDDSGDNSDEAIEIVYDTPSV